MGPKSRASQATSSQHLSSTLPTNSPPSPTNNTTPENQHSTDSDDDQLLTNRRVVTRSMTGNLPPSSVQHAMSTTEIIAALDLVHPGQKITIRYHVLPHLEVMTSVATCVKRQDKAVDLRVPDLDENEVIRLPVPPNHSWHALQILKLTPHEYFKLPLKPYSECNLQPDVDAKAIIYVDGSTCHEKGGPASSAISVFTLVGSQVHRQNFGRFYPGATSNCVAAAAMLAALRFAKMHVPRDGNITIVTTSQLVYKHVTGEQRFKDSKLVTVGQQLNDIVDASFALRISFCHLHWAHKNYADEICKSVLNLGKPLGDLPELFMDLPYVNTPRHRTQRVLPPVVEPQLPEPMDIQSIEDFAKLRTFKARTSVPPEAELLWANLVRRSAQAVVAATDMVERDKNIIELMLLPMRYLPANVRTTRIVTHLKSGTPFHIDHRKQSQEVRERAADREMHRLKEQIHRLGRDGKIKTANKLIRNQATRDDMPHDEKVEGLKKKFVNKDTADESEEVFAIRQVPIFTGFEVRSALRKINRQCATGADGWSKDHLMSALRGSEGLDDILGSIFTTIASQRLSPLLEDVLRCGRLVGIPKPDNAGVRPITIAALFMKVFGTMSMARDDVKPSQHQYAIGHKDGCLKVIHQIRDELANLHKNDPTAEYVAIKVDISNAFNELARHTVRKELKEHCETMKQFFRVAYGGSSPLIVYGPDGFSMINMEEGIRQGDATSTYLFCIGVDRALRELLELKYRCWMFCDDLTLIVRKCEVEATLEAVKRAFAKVGLRVNEAKLDIYGPTDVRTKPFVLLGADLACTEEFTEKQLLKQAQYFELLDRIPMHAQLKAVLLRVCGAPRLRYITSAMPPNSTKRLTEAFDKGTVSALSKIVQLSEEDLEASGLLHDTMGAGIPKYTELREKLYAAARNYAIDGVHTPVELVTKGDDSRQPLARHNMDAQWLWYDGSMSPAEFCTAFCVRLGIVQPHLRVHPARCDCGKTITNDVDQIQHTFTCDQFTSTTHTRRHNMLRDEICRVCMSFGISAVKEPTCYLYEEGRKRPDIIFGTHRTLVTDVTIVNPQGEPGEAAKTADEKKRKQHGAAVERQQHVFIPGACEAYGLIGPGMVKLVKELAHNLPLSTQFIFRRTMMNAIATVLARSRASGIYGTRYRRDHIMPH